MIWIAALLIDFHAGGTTINCPLVCLRMDPFNPSCSCGKRPTRCSMP